MGRKHNEASKRFHDRVASKYDQIYDDPFWEFHDRVTWNHLKNFLPKGGGAPVLDLGCGTGKWGLKLLKAGFAVTFADLSVNMLDKVREKLEAWKQQPDLAGKAARATVVLADAVDLKELGEGGGGHFQLVVGMGDVVSICSDPARAVAQMARVLAVGGMAVFTVDNTLAALEHFTESGNLEALAGFVKSGETHWLTNSQTERFEVHMFLPGEIDSLTKSKGFEIVSRIGKTILPVRMNKRFFEGEGAMERLVDLEARLGKDPTALARASHIQIAARKM